MKKNALIVVNLAGFLCFLWNDIRILINLGYFVSIAGNGKMKDGCPAIELEQIERMGLTFHHIEFDTKNPISRINVTAYRQIQNLLKKESYDLVHCHTPIVGLLTRCAANKFRKHGTRVVYTTHGFTFTDHSSIKEWFLYFTIEKFASRFSDAIITINHEDYKNAKAMHCKKVFYIHGVGIDTNRFITTKIDRNEYRKKIGVEPDQIMVLSVGELSERKNHQIIIRAIASLPQRKRYTYIICGREVVNSGIEDFLTELAEKSGVKLVLAGHRSDIPEINRCSDIAAIPSLREGLGLAGIEALASGTPVIGANVQGIREYVIDGESGYLCNPYSIENYANAIIKLSGLTLSEKETFAKHCVEISLKFDIAVSRQEMQKIYLEVLE